MSNSLIVLSSSIVSVFVGVGALVIGTILGIFLTRLIINKKILSNKTTAAKLLEEAYAEAKTVKKEALLEAKEEMHQLRNELDKEIKERRVEIQKTEDRLIQREEFLDKKELSFEKKAEQLEESRLENLNYKNSLNKKLEEQEEIEKKIIKELERVAQLGKEEAKNLLIKEITEDARKESVKQVKEIEEKALNNANKKARDIVALAIQKCATDVTSEITISVVSIPNDDMKGRIIGREGRNIRAIENVMGVDLIVDDTPEAITVSCFDPVRREIARLSLERLIIDGRIHPTRIEEIVTKVTKEIDQTIKQAGEDAIEEANIFGMHPELVKTLGRLKYRTSYGQNCLKHSLETSFLAGLLATEIGADVKVAKRAGLLHDIGKALDHEVEGTHVSIGVDLAKRYKESQAVIHCIEAHHFGVEFNSVEAVLVQVADSISSSRPGARKATLENYVKRLEKLEEICNSFKGVEKSFALQAGREVRILVKPNEISDETAHFLAEDIAKRIENEMEYPGQVKVNVIRESRFSATAK
ncbi:MAG: ribonuclease Y [Clostridia bacterium]|nr:ribonuclease Y [Clostridia bacterium]